MPPTDLQWEAQLANVRAVAVGALTGVRDRLDLLEKLIEAPHATKAGQIAYLDHCRRVVEREIADLRDYTDQLGCWRLKACPKCHGDLHRDSSGLDGAIEMACLQCGWRLELEHQR